MTYWRRALTVPSHFLPAAQHHCISLQNLSLQTDLVQQQYVHQYLERAVTRAFGGITCTHSYMWLENKARRPRTEGGTRLWASQASWELTEWPRTLTRRTPGICIVHLRHRGSLLPKRMASNQSTKVTNPMPSRGAAESSRRVKEASYSKVKMSKSSCIIFLFKWLGLGVEVGSARASSLNELQMKESRHGKINITGVHSAVH